MSESNPYLNARREWDERYGSALSRMRTWQITAVCALAVTALAVAGVVIIGAQSKIQPYVIQVDRLGSPVAVAQPAAAGGAVEQRVAVATVANWVWEARTMLHDQAAQKVLIDRVYAMAGKDAAAYLNRWYQTHSPFGDTSTAVTLTSVMPISANTYQVSWDEVPTDNGMPGPVQHWKAQVTTGQDARFAQTPKVQIATPFGLYIKDLTWTQITNEAK